MTWSLMVVDLKELWRSIHDIFQLLFLAFTWRVREDHEPSCRQFDMCQFYVYILFEGIMSEGVTGAHYFIVFFIARTKTVSHYLCM